MSLDYGTLKTAVLDNAHRPNLTTQVVEFIRKAEGLIRRELRAYEVAATLAEADRSSDGTYNLPSGLLEVRNLYNAAGVALEHKGLAELRTLSTTSDVLWYALSVDQIEFRGVPGLNEEVQLVYLGWPAALSGDSDTNDLLALHESLYLDGALGYLYEWSQDTELADRAFQRFYDAIEKLNQQHGRRIGGTSAAGAYNFGNFPTSSGY